MDYRVSFSLSITDAAALWRAAAKAAMNAPGMTLDDVTDTIGSEHDPEIADCLAMLLQPASPAGCMLRSLTCDALGDPSLVAAVVARPVAVLRGGYEAHRCR